MSIDNENELELDAESIDETTETPVEESAEPAEYTPNYSYSVKDEELEFDEGFRTLITSKEMEEKMRDLHTKAAGLDGYKSKYGELEGQTNALVQGFNTLKDLRDSKDMRGLMKALNIDEETLLDFTEVILTEKELPEEQRRLVEENRALNERMSGFESQLSGIKKQESSQRVNDDLAELESLIVSDSYKPTAQAMMSVGINMSEEVLTAGHMEFVRTGKEPSVASVVKAISDKYAYLTKTQAEEKPHIPAVGGSGGTAVSSKITSIDDLRKLRASL